MSKAPSPLLGYNNNVRHKSRVFHIQTEDSGVRHPHIITHLFMDGGRILKSVKKSYAEHLGTEGLSDVVRQMMKEQHKAMFIALRGGHFDHLVDAASDSAPPSLRAKAPEAAAPKADSDVPVSVPLPSQAAESAKPSEPAPSPASPAPPTSPDSPVAATAPDSAPAPETPPASTAPEAREQPPSQQPAQAVSARAPERETELTLDIDALEPPPADTRVDLPPAPDPFPRPPRVESPPPEPLRDLSPQLFKKRADTFRFRQGKETRATEALLSTTLPKASPPPGSGPPKAPLAGAGLPKPAAPGPLPKPVVQERARATHDPLRDRLPAFLRGDVPPSSGSAPVSSGIPDTDKVPPSSQPSKPALPQTATGSEGRYAPARPAAIFGHARPQQGSSIFGEDLISDKSLDEVILSYLAEDLEADKK
ncbi:hypothetical protein LZC95_40920 [Pendulispora brunnea]|uniref:Uncharacterized protein n=1 Tax=Pendulispora brunnea TaxID=2905690 RepID=A0ABZ2K610_9BACT